MYGRINRANICPTRADRERMRREAGVYSQNHRLFTALRGAYIDGVLTKEQLLTLRSMVMAGDAEGAERGLKKIALGE